MLVLEGIRFPKIHDLDRLIQLVPAGFSVASHGTDLSWLSDWSPDTRYPGDLAEADRPDAVKAIEIAVAILGLVSDDLATRGVRSDSSG